jgi:hypothetical protein
VLFLGQRRKNQPNHHKTMKKLITFFCAAALMSAIGAGCGNSNGSAETRTQDSENVILPVTPSDEVAAFFERYLRDFSFGDVDQNLVLLINNMEEFEKIALPTVELPSIDFDKFTLVVGQYAKSGGQIPTNRSIDARPDLLILNLMLEQGNGITMMSTAAYWDIYPKLPQKPITVKITVN